MRVARLPSLCVLISVTFAAVTACPGGPEETPCDRHRSKIARDVVGDFILVHLAKSGHAVPEQCFFHPKNDRLLVHEHHKRPLRQDRWQCGYCGKVFKGEDFLDRHLASTHADALPPASSTHCLADRCPQLHCDYFDARWRGQLQHWRDVEPRPCNHTHVQAQRAACMQLAAQCFVDAAGVAMPTYDWFVKHFCGAITCNVQTQQHLLRQVPKVHKSRSYKWVVLAAMVMAVLVVAYTGLWMCSLAAMEPRGPGLHPSTRFKAGRGSLMARLFGKFKKL